MAKQKTEVKKPRQSKKEQPKAPEQLPPVENVTAPGGTKPETPIKYPSQKEAIVIPERDGSVTVTSKEEILSGLKDTSTNLIWNDDSKLLVDRKLFYEAMSALTQGHTYGYTMQPAMSKFAKMMGAKDRNEEIVMFNECQKYLKEIKK